MAAAALLEAVNIFDVLPEFMTMIRGMTRAEALATAKNMTIVGGPPAAAQQIVGHLFEGAHPDATIEEHLSIPTTNYGPTVYSSKRGPLKIKKRPKIRESKRSISEKMAKGHRRAILVTPHVVAARKIQQAARQRIQRRTRISQKRYGTKQTAIATTTPMSQKPITVLKRVCTAPAPTSNEGGATFVAGRIRNSTSKTSPNGSFGVGWAFYLNQMFQYAEYVNTYQWYKILYVKLYFYPSANAIPAIASSNGAQSINGTGTIVGMAPHMCLAPDRSSSTKFSSMNEAMAHAGAVFHVFNDPGKEFSYYCTPKPTSLVGSAGSEIQTMGTENPWISTANASVPYYGLRGFFENFNDHSWLDVKMEMKVAFKGVKQ